jgi:hypothetical protein
VVTGFTSLLSLSWAVEFMYDECSQTGMLSYLKKETKESSLAKWLER